MKHQLVVGVLLFLRKHFVQLLRPCHDVVPRLGNTFGLAIIDETENVRLEQIRFPNAVVFGVFGNDVGNFGRVFIAKLALGPAQLISATSSFVIAAGFQAMRMKNSIGISSGLRSPTLTIQMRVAPYS